VNRMMTLLACTGIVWPAPAAVQVCPRYGAPGAIRESRAAIQRARKPGQVRVGRYLSQACPQAACC